MFCYLEGYPMMILGNYHAVLRELLLTKNRGASPRICLPGRLAARGASPRLMPSGHACATCVSQRCYARVVPRLAPAVAKCP